MIGVTSLESEVFQRLVSYLEQHFLKPLIAKVFLLSQIKETQKFFQSKIFLVRFSLQLQIILDRKN